MLLFDKLALCQYAQVFGHRLPACVKVFGNGIGGHCLKCDQYKDRPSGRVGNSLKNVSSHSLVNFESQLFGCKYMCNYSVAQIFLKKIFIWAEKLVCPAERQKGGRAEGKSILRPNRPREALSPVRSLQLRTKYLVL